MAKIVRFNGNLVAPASAALGTERTLFGSVTQADDLTSQFTADLLRGWGTVGPSDQPTLQDFNAMGYTLGHLHAYLHQMGVAEWNPDQEYHIGSLATVNGLLFTSTTDNNVGNDPSTNATNWQPEGYGSTAVVMTGSNVTLTPLQAARSIIVITGVLTANLQLIFPNYIKSWQVINNTTGNFTITCKTSAGTGVGITGSTVRSIVGDGTNIVSSAANNVGLNMVAFTAAGVTVWPVPLVMQLGLVKPRVTVVGGGGGGSKISGTTGVGGGGGGSSMGIVDLTGVTSVTVTVGASGLGGVGAAPVAGASGGTSSFGAFMSATGGAGGNTAGNKAIGGAGTGGQVNFDGGSANGALGNGNGGNSLWGQGGLGPTAGSGQGSNGYTFGAGGAGSSGGLNTGNGSIGLVIIEW